MSAQQLNFIISFPYLIMLLQYIYIRNYFLSIVTALLVFILVLDLDKYIDNTNTEVKMMLIYIFILTLYLIFNTYKKSKK
jgi:hypothetical protein